MSHLIQSRLPVFLLILLIPLLAACSLSDFITRPESNDADTPLMVITTQGGLCMYGACSIELTVFRDSSHLAQQGDYTLRLGERMDPAQFAAFTSALEAADFDALRATPFTDICPIAYDGQQVIYTFYINGRVEVLDSCAYLLDENDPLIQTAWELFMTYTAVP